MNEQTFQSNLQLNMLKIHKVLVSTFTWISTPVTWMIEQITPTPMFRYELDKPPFKLMSVK